MIVYHGSADIVKQPDVLHSYRRLDFGKGFYVMTNYEQAERWAKRKADLLHKDKAYINIYEMLDDDSAFKVKTFPDDLLEWIDFVCDCRDGNTNYQTYDIIKGKVADDKVFRVVDLYHTYISVSEREGFFQKEGENALCDLCMFVAKYPRKDLKFISYLDKWTLDSGDGYAIGDYKKKPNMVGSFKTCLPVDVPFEMEELIKWYQSKPVSLDTIAKFHLRYEVIHPFQDGNGQTGRLIVFRECLRNNISPLIIEDKNRKIYINALMSYREIKDVSAMTEVFKQEQKNYEEECRYFTENDIS